MLNAKMYDLWTDYSGEGRMKAEIVHKASALFADLANLAEPERIQAINEIRRKEWQIFA